MKIQIVSSLNNVPRQAVAQSAGYDLVADIPERLHVHPGHRAIISTGVAIAIPENHVGFIQGRSGLSCKGIICPTGTIDCGYTGVLKVMLMNLSDWVFHVDSGSRIAQLVILPIVKAEFELVESLPETTRGTNGFGSSGLL